MKLDSSQAVLCPGEDTAPGSHRWWWRAQVDLRRRPEKLVHRLPMLDRWCRPLPLSRKLTPSLECVQAADGPRVVSKYRVHVVSAP